MTEPDNLAQTEPRKHWTTDEVLAWCRAHGKPAHLFLSPQPPRNPKQSHSPDRCIQAVDCGA